jgi:hypothetical protein
MYRDLRKGAPVEADHILDVFIERGSTHGGCHTIIESRFGQSLRLSEQAAESLMSSRSFRTSQFQAARCEFASKGGAVSEASAVRTRGATRVPSSSIARSIFACGNAATLI